MLGRDGFYIHGRRPQGNDGCIVSSTAIEFNTCFCSSSLGKLAMGLGPHHRQLLQAIVAVQQQVVSLEQMLSLINIWIADPSKSITALISERAVASLETTQSLEDLSNSDSATAEYIASVGANTGELYATIDQLGLVLNEKPDFSKALQEIRQEIQATSILPIEHMAPPQIRRESMSQKIGNFKLLQKLGEGGMGTVWMAEQEKPVRRHVALKVIKAGLADQQILARFEAERQALAMMDHVNIARVYDAGTTETSQPFFVMELVKGIPFAEYCDQHSLSLEDRLQLFIPICRAVHHAHQKGIIHRDLKPSNVLVALVDGVPVPKVIDFGLAKAIQQQTKLSERTMFTEFGQVVGTLRYMSPEQAEMNALDVDTRTDIYSLGVMLYEVLTGTTPLEKATLENEPIYRVLEAIRTKEPPRPSDRLSSSSLEAIAGISLQRRIDYMLGMALFAQSKQVDAERFLLAAYRELEEQKSKLPQEAVLSKIPSEMMVRTIDSLIEVYSSSDRRNERDKWERLKTELSGNQRSNK